MRIIHHQSLQQTNTFGIDQKAKGLIAITCENDIFEVLTQDLKPLKILGGGSNVLLTGDVDAYVLKNEIKGIEIVDEDENQILIKVGAGEQWHQLVLWSLSHKLGGLENLSLIPGSVGAAPMQNIGAYGVEQDTCFHSLQAVELSSGVRRVFFKEECKFGYRESIFKNEAKDQYFITHVCYLLHKKNYSLHLSYGAIKEVLQEKNITNPTLNDVSEAVISIRQSKLPDPRIIGNAGSFFKNPVIHVTSFNSLKVKYPTIPSYDQGNGWIKVPAGWLIEQTGFKGKRIGNIGVHKDQALVLVNYSNGSGNEIWKLALEIKSAVKAKFDIEMSPEVNIW